MMNIHLRTDADSRAFALTRLLTADLIVNTRVQLLKVEMRAFFIVENCWLEIEGQVVITELVTVVHHLDLLIVYAGRERTTLRLRGDAMHRDQTTACGCGSLPCLVDRNHDARDGW